MGGGSITRSYCTQKDLQINTTMRNITDKLIELGVNQQDGYLYNIKEISKLYLCSVETIKTIVKRNKKLFLDNGEILLYDKHDQIFRFLISTGKINSKTRKILLINVFGIIRIAYYVKRNEIANIIKDYIMRTYPILHNEMNQGYSDNMHYKKYEEELGILLHRIFGSSHKIVNQFKIDNYYIDFLSDDKIAIECDENGHVGYDKKREVVRESKIINSGYKLLRYDTRNENIFKFIGEICDQLSVS